MKLSSKSLKKLFKGAVYFVEDKGWLTPYRYSRTQIEYMADESYDWGWRMRAKFAGTCRIELKTDAEHISFDYVATHEHERANTFDLFVDGVLCAVHKIEDRLKGTVEFKMKGGEKRVTIYMPCECEIKIKNFTLDGSYKGIRTTGQKLLIIGDSITQGAGPEVASVAYANELQRMTKWDILAQGIGGYRYEACDLMKVEGFEPDKIFVFLGTNYYDLDCEERSYHYKEAVEEFYEKITSLYPTTPIYAITPLWRNNDVDWDRFYWCIQAIKDTCAKHKGVTLADGFDFVPNVDECFSDKIHPNAYGSYLLAKNLAEFLK